MTRLKPLSVCCCYNYQFIFLAHLDLLPFIGSHDDGYPERLDPCSGGCSHADSVEVIIGAGLAVLTILRVFTLLTMACCWV